MRGAEGPTEAERLVRERIHADGRLTFAAFMETALYDPEAGYYARGVPLGSGGDYYTSPELHSAFAALIGRQIYEVWLTLGRPVPFVLHEVGPGRGLFARDLLDWARAERPELYGALAYRLDERSATLRIEQERRLLEAGHAARVTWVDGFGDGPLEGVVFANELLDALPVHLVEQRDGRLRELFVGREDGALVLTAGEPSTPALGAYFDRLGVQLGEGCRAEVNLAAPEWIGEAGRALRGGLLLVLDYGYPAEVLYAPTRRAGTLLCYAGHTLNSDPLRNIGEQDITSHVDFTSVARAGEVAGLRTLGLVSQRRLLANLGWEELRAAVAAAALGQAERGANLRALDGLVDPDGLGRLLALVQQRGLDGFVPRGLVGRLSGSGDPASPAGQGEAHPWPAQEQGWLPLRGADHVRLPDPAETEDLGDFEEQWAELMAGADEEE